MNETPTNPDKDYKKLKFPIIEKEEKANEIIKQILENEYAVIGVDTEAAVEMSRFGILCLIQVIYFIIYYYTNIDIL